MNIERFLSRYTRDPEIFQAWMERAKKGEPLTKIVNERYFWEDAFFINEHVLDPRFESETLIEGVLKSFPDKNTPFRFLDLGTGSGCLLISLLHEFPNSTGVGVDISPQALDVARRNGAFLKDRIDFRLGNWWEPVKDESFDIVISNPPYIGIHEPLDASVLDFDPHLALFAGEDGLDAYRVIFPYLSTVGFFEIGYQQEKSVTRLAHHHGLGIKDSFKDLLGFTRVLRLERECNFQE